MAKNTIPRGETSVIRHVFIQDSASTTGGGKTGLAYNTGSLTGYYIYPGGTATALTLETISTLGTYAAPTSNAHMRFKEVDATNMPGWYELQFHNDWFSVANARRGASLQLKGASGMAQLNLEIDCIGMEIQSATPSVSLAAILATALTESVAGYLTSGFKKLFDVATPVFTSASVNQTGDAYAGTTSILSKLLKYFQLALRKDAAIATDNSTELTAINANGGSGAGAFSNQTDAGEAIRDRGDAAWITATGFSTLDASGVRTAIGMASANLDTQLATILASSGGGAGAITWPVTVEDDSGNTIADVDVWVTSDISGTIVLASGKTDGLGVVTFYLDAGTYYCWRQKSGYNFTNPQSITVT